MKEVLRECIRNFGEAPRRFGLVERMTYLRMPRPSWLLLNPSDGMATQFRYKRELLRNGKVVWGHLVQANTLLYQRGRHSCPGEVVYSMAPPLTVDPAHLEAVAMRLFSLKDTRPYDADLAYIADYLTNEMIRVYGLEVPEDVSPGFPCRVSTTFFFRKHLPGRRLSNSFFPLIVNPAEPHVVLPLPARYWPKDFAAWWSS